MGIAFPPSVPRGGDAHQPRVLPVLHIAHKDAILDQHVLLAWRAFVVDRDRPAPVGNGPVIQHRHAPRGDLFAHEARKGACALAVEIALKPVAYRLVQQDSRPAIAEHHIHHPRRRRLRFKIDLGDPQRLAHMALPHVGGNNAAQIDPPATARAAAFAPPVLFDDHRDIQPRHRPDIGHKRAFGPKDRHLLKRGRDRGRDLHNARIKAAGIGVNLGQ